MEESIQIKKSILCFLLIVILSVFLVSCLGEGEQEEDQADTNQPPVATFTASPESGVAPLNVTLDGSASHDPDGDIIEQLWEFGDGTSSNETGDVAYHIYESAGSYTAKLTVTDNNGATAIATKTISCDEGFLWESEIDDEISYYSSPAVGADGTIYFGTGAYLWTDWGSLYAFNPDGSMKWKRDLDPYENVQYQYPRGDNAYSPAIGADGTIYVQGCTSALYAFDPDGNRNWKYVDYDTYPLAFALGHRTPAIGQDGTLYVSADGLYAVNPDGNRKWKLQNPSGTWWCRASPVIGSDGTIYAVEESCDENVTKLSAVNPDGTLQWEFWFDSETEMSLTSPAIDSNGVIYFGAEELCEPWRGFLYAVYPNGTKKWRHVVEGNRRIRSSPSIGTDGTIYVGTMSVSAETSIKFLALNHDDGTLKWAFEAEPGQYAPPDIICSPAVGDDGTIYFSSMGFFYVLDPDGNEEWTLKLNGMAQWVSPALLDDGRLYTVKCTTSEQDEHCSALWAIQTFSLGLADSPWPKFRRNNRNTGRYND